MTTAVADRECGSALRRTTPAIVYFPSGLPGFEDLRRWEIVESDEQRPLCWLRAVERPQLALLLADPGQLLPAYRPEIPAGTWSRLGDGSEGRRRYFAVVSASASGFTANLRAPLVIDLRTMRGEQVILDGDEWPVRFELARPDERATRPGTRRSPACSSSAEK
ncbi:MAG: flagellar assembly protein FliW [Acidobacteria bacterium]|jgi:flagellar assembly factor FliW|nr:flagellar assembly protein FliW [Acidobacteriota bacterium]MCU0255002.1 flagellar assembly protein FliW [Acidobacteriota bacterium]